MATPRPTCDMNMTPMIDVLLVLLVIFMAALPLTQKGLDVQLPQEVEKPGAPAPDRQIVIEVDAARRVAINRQEVAMEALQERLQAIFGDRRDKTLFISAARTLRYRVSSTSSMQPKGPGWSASASSPTACAAPPAADQMRKKKAGAPLGSAGLQG